MRTKYRQATIDDALMIHELELKVWGSNAATLGNIKNRVNTFPQGNVIAITDNKIVGYVSGVIMNSEYAEKCKTWYDYTDNGDAKRCFDPLGDLLFGTSLTVDNDTRNAGIGSSLLLRIARMCIENNLKAGILGGRIPYYYKKKGMSAEEYVELNDKDGKIFDPELRLYLRMGLRIVKVQKDYFKDPESLDYGVILRWENPFYKLTKLIPFLAKPLSYLFSI
jgi:ribosomal protein S18 acetylase RimI-like enzyme